MLNIQQFVLGRLIDRRNCQQTVFRLELVSVNFGKFQVLPSLLIDVFLEGNTPQLDTGSLSCLTFTLYAAGFNVMLPL